MNILKVMIRNIVFFCAYVMIYTRVPARADSGKDFYHAASVGDISKVRQLAGDQCKYVNWQNPDDGRFTPLFTAAGGEHEEVVKYLLACKADPNIRADHGYTAIMLAAVQPKVSIVKSILTAKPNLDFQITSGEASIGATALMLAAAMSNNRVVSALVNAGAQTDIQDAKGNTALHWAAGLGKKDNVETLLKSDIDIKIENNKGQTATQVAMEKGFWVIASLIDSDCVPYCGATGNTDTITTPNTATTASAKIAPAITATIMLLRVILIHCT